MEVYKRSNTAKAKRFHALYYHLVTFKDLQKLVQSQQSVSGDNQFYNLQCSNRTGHSGPGAYLFTGIDKPVINVNVTSVPSKITDSLPDFHL